MHVYKTVEFRRTALGFLLKGQLEVRGGGGEALTSKTVKLYGEVQ